MISMLSRPLILFALFILIAGCAAEMPPENQSAIQEEASGSQPAEEEGRTFLMGVVPTPKNAPDSTFDDLTDAYKEAGELGEVMMVWVSPQGIGQYEKLKANKVITAARANGLKPVLTLSFATIEEVPGEGLAYVVNAPEGVAKDLSDPGFRERWVQEAKDIAQEFKPEYFSLGNEINDYFYLHPDELDDYISLYDEAYSAIKEVSPGTKVFVVFSYTHMIDNNQQKLIQELESRVDMIGLTTYPWKHYDKPEDIPSDYYDINTAKPIAFTEIGWASESEDEQVRFLDRFLEITEGKDVEMINWLFLHEPVVTGVVASVTDPETSTIALKYKNGTKKKIYYEWEELSEVAYDG